MKKSIVMLSAAVAVSGIFFGCKSTKTIDLTDYAPIAIASVYSNSSVPWYEKSSYDIENETTGNGGLVTSQLNKVLEQNNPEYQTVQSRIDEAADILAHCLEENGIPVVDKELLKESPAYKSGYNKFLQIASTSTSADGYLALDYAGKNRNRAIATTTGARGTIFAEFIFQKEKIQKGFKGSDVRARVTMKVYVANANGDKVLYNTYTGVSVDSIDYDNGGWDRNTIVSYFPAVIESVCNQFIMEYTGATGAVENVDSVESEKAQSTSLSIPRSKSNETSEPSDVAVSE